ncbi:hypothetical protein [Cupriavidus basilensis]
MPDSAVLDTGARQLVLVQREEGKFEPRPVKLGMHADGYVEVLEGVKAGEMVVSANFLIDAESNLKAAIGGMGGMAMGDAKPAAAKDGEPAAATAATGKGWQTDGRHAHAAGQGSKARRYPAKGALTCWDASSNGQCATSFWCC